jgi:acyl carrier protein
MTIKTIEELGSIAKLDYLINLSLKKFHINLDINKNFTENEFDMVELIQELEKEFDIYLYPTLEEILVYDENFKIKDMYKLELRNKKLDELLNT